MTEIEMPPLPKFHVSGVGQSTSCLITNLQSKQVVNLPSSMIYDPDDSGDGESTSPRDGKTLQWFEREVGGLQLVFLVVDFSDDDARDLYPQMIQMAIDRGCFVLVFPASGRITGKISIRGLMDQGVFIVEQAKHPSVDPGEIIVNGIKALADISFVPGMIGVDYEDIKQILTSSCGYTFLAQGQGASCNEASEDALTCFRSAGIDLKRAKGIIVGISAGAQPPGIHEVDAGLNLIQQVGSEDANVIFGVVADDPSLGKEVRVSVFAFGFDTRRAMVSS